MLVDLSENISARIANCELLQDSARPRQIRFATFYEFHTNFSQFFKLFFGSKLEGTFSVFELILS